MMNRIPTLVALATFQAFLVSPLAQAAENFRNTAGSPEEQLRPHSASFQLRLLRFDEILPPDGKLRCLAIRSEDFGYEIIRSANDEISIYIITNGQSEGEKSKKTAVIKRDNPFQMYLYHHQRRENFGMSIEVVLEKQLDPSTGKYPGAIMFTEFAYSKDQDGNEKEEIYPVARRLLRCGPEPL